MSPRLRISPLKAVTIGAGLLLSTFIVSLLICVVTHTTPGALVESLASEEIRFAI